MKMYGIKINGLPSRPEMTTEKSMSDFSYTEHASYPLRSLLAYDFHNFCALLVGP